MKFEIRNTEWHKRRVRPNEIKAVSVEVIGFEKVDNGRCIMNATYDNGETYELSGRINLNTILDKWTVAGYDPHGKMVMCDVIEE